jgi:hypothetical protein
VQRWLRQYLTDQDLDQVLRLRRAPLDRPHGTELADWTGCDGDPWADFHLAKVHLSGTDEQTTFKVLVNQGLVEGRAGGVNYTSDDVHYLDLDSAEDQTVQFKNVTDNSGAGNNHASVVARVVAADTDTMFLGDSRPQAGDDTRLYEVVNGAVSLLDSIALGYPPHPAQFKLVVATRVPIELGQADIDFTLWEDGQPEPSPQITGTYAINAALQGKSGFGGIWTRSSRDNTHLVDDLQFTNNDMPATGLARSHSVIVG